MRVSLIEPLDISEKIINQLAQPLRDAGHTFDYYLSKTTDPEELYQRCRNADIVMIANNPLPGQVIRRLSQTQLINIAFTGVDHVDLNAAKKQGITVSNASGYSIHAVPELAIGLTLAVYRKISESDSETRLAEQFQSKRIGKELYGKTVGIIGTGQLGLETAKLYKAFGCKIIGYNRSEKVTALELGLEYKALDDVLRQSDVLSIHLPLTDETKRIISEDKLKLMQSDAIIINVARGGLIDNKALAHYLNEGLIAGAGIDVYDTEPPLTSDTALIHAKNCVLMPHVGYFTQEAMLERAKIVFDNTLQFIEGNPQNVVV